MSFILIEDRPNINMMKQQIICFKNIKLDIKLFDQKQYHILEKNKNILQKTDSHRSQIVKIRINMKEIEFQHFRKAPHPFEQYGNLPPGAYKNRSILQDYASLPQGQQAFVNKVGKKQFQDKYKSSIKQHWLGSVQNDSLSRQLAQQNHKIKGKSLQTRDIEGAQGGSLKSPAVKYKQKAQQLKISGKLNGFDKYDFQQQNYKFQIQNALKNQHLNDIQIGKLISKKGYGNIFNPEKNQYIDKNMNSKNAKKSSEHKNHQIFLKEKYDNFESKNEQYKQFFKGLKSKQDNYDQFFGKLKQNISIQKPQEQIKGKREKVNTFDQYDSKDMPTPKITSRQYEYGVQENLKTIQPEYQLKRHSREGKQEYNMEKHQELLGNYSPPNFAKSSIQNQFKEEQHLGVSLNLSRVINQKTNDARSLSSSRKKEKSIEFQKDAKMAYFEKQLSRKFNPTNLSHVIGPGSFF